MVNKKTLKNIISFGLAFLVLVIPSSWIPIENLTTVEHRVIAIFVLAASLWITEAIPIFATSILIIVLELLTISSSGINFLIAESGTPHFGTVLDYKEIMATFASPIILLFLGGFFLSLASTKYRLDQNLARVLLKPFGSRPSMIIFGLMVITAVFSMFMSNTATTAMMLSIIAPVMVYYKPEDPGRIGLVLSIPLAANIGGIGTPIGTPPNALALKYLTGNDYVSFGQWMGFGIPFVVIMLFIGWFMLIRFFPSNQKRVDIVIKGKFLKTNKALIVYITFGLTILLWLTDFIHGINSYTVATIPIAVFLAFNIINKEDLKKLSWDVLWLVSGGIALGLALAKSGLAEHVVNSIPFGAFSPYLIIVLTVLLAALMANFMSNTATANLLLPIIATLGTTVVSLHDLGGAKMLILATSLAASLGLALPISTPPNALAHATGLLSTKNMAKVGVLTGVIGMVLIFFTLYILKTIGFL